MAGDAVSDSNRPYYQNFPDAPKSLRKELEEHFYPHDVFALKECKGEPAVIIEVDTHQNIGGLTIEKVQETAHVVAPLWPWDEPQVYLSGGLGPGELVITITELPQTCLQMWRDIDAKESAMAVEESEFWEPINDTNVEEW